MNQVLYSKNGWKGDVDRDNSLKP